MPAEMLGAVGNGRLAVRLPNWIGDAVLSVPALRAVRAAAPEAWVELHGRPEVAEVVESLEGLADAVVRASAATPAGIIRDARALGGAAAAVLLPNSFAAVLPAWLARVPIRVGAATDARGALLTRSTRPSHRLHQAAYYRAVVEASVDFDPALAAVAPARAAPSRLLPARPFVALAPGAAHGGAKRWPAVRYAEVGRSARDRGLEVVVVGSPAEIDLADRVAEAAGGQSLAGRTSAGDLVDLLAAARAAVVNDSGAMHLAVALGTPTVAVFGATDPARTGPITGRYQLLHAPQPCSPCELRECPRRRHQCMQAISVAEVVAALERVLTGEAA